MRRAMHVGMILLAAASVAASVTAIAAPGAGPAKPAGVKPPPPPAPPPPPTLSADVIAAGQRGFVEVAHVLQSPRCQNCHPAGDAPLQTDAGRPHAMNISRRSVAAGLPCRTCHQERNSEALGIIIGPPGAPHWGLPPRDTPMVFQGKSVHALCEQLKDPAQNNKRSLADLLEHVSHDPLVLWGWSPGGTRTLPPLTHDVFVAAFQAWVASDGACPP
ncbi:MAG: hypothetical protein K8W52_27385 [Deltaproteobacteria bacterium]|nr:hypothetical protein [Deltaproteobacteria bacterium]